MIVDDERTLFAEIIPIRLSSSSGGGLISVRVGSSSFSSSCEAGGENKPNSTSFAIPVVLSLLLGRMGFLGLGCTLEARGAGLKSILGTSCSWSEVEGRAINKGPSGCG